MDKNDYSPARKWFARIVAFVVLIGTLAGCNILKAVFIDKLLELIN